MAEACGKPNILPRCQRNFAIKVSNIDIKVPNFDIADETLLFDIISFLVRYITILKVNDIVYMFNINIIARNSDINSKTLISNLVKMEDFFFKSKN